MSNYDFKKDLIVGENGEDTVANDLIKMGGKLISNNKNNKFDLIIEKNGENIKYEIKTDVFCKPYNDTGNIFVEFECRGKESGIIVTEAKWFVTYYKFLNEIWYIKTKDLLNLIKISNFKTTQFSGDSGSNTKGYLIPRFQLKNNFIVRKT